MNSSYQHYLRLSRFKELLGIFCIDNKDMDSRKCQLTSEDRC